MQLNEGRVKTLGQRIKEEGLTDRHRERTRAEYRTVFGVETTPESGKENLDLIFSRVIQARANPLSSERYQELANQELLQNVIEQDTHEEAFEVLYNTRDIGQKIANELLRHVVDLFGIREEWRSDLDIALDTHVVQALIKTGAIDLEGRERDRVIADPDTDPRVLIPYQDVQNAFNKAAMENEFDPIVFDELWLEHREFMSDPLLHDRSIFSDLARDD
jgi:hypothetical protein